MLKLIYTIFISIGVLNACAENTTKYLPCKITSPTMIYEAEYDSLNRIIKEDVTEFRNGVQISKNTYSNIYNSEGLIKQTNIVIFESIKDKKRNNPIANITEFYQYEKTDSLITCNRQRQYNYWPDADKSSFGENWTITFNTYHNEQVIHSESSEGTSVTTIEYDAFQNIKTLKQKDSLNNFNFKKKTCATDFDTQKGIFSDININPYQKSLQVNNLFLHFTTKNPTQLTIEIQEEEEKIEQIHITYTYNKDGYPSAMSMKNSKEDEPEEFKIEYLIVNK